MVRVSIEEERKGGRVGRRKGGRVNEIKKMKGRYVQGRTYVRKGGGR